jgi:hypothetical protein
MLFLAESVKDCVDIKLSKAYNAPTNILGLNKSNIEMKFKMSLKIPRVPLLVILLQETQSCMSYGLVTDWGVQSHQP